MHISPTQAEKIQMLCASLKEKESILSDQRVTVGFDGFVDTIVRVVKSKTEEQGTIPFGQIKEFGTYVVDKSSQSFGLELEEKVTKIGGNMPILSGALAQLGIGVHCIGALGYPAIHPVFHSLPTSCQLYSFTDPGEAIALEFNDGKIILSKMNSLNSIRWEDIKAIVGLDVMVRLFEQCNLLAIVNWSEVAHASEIWEGLLNEVLPYCHISEKRPIFFDLTDISSRSQMEINRTLSLMKAFKQFGRVVLSLNRNEAQLVHQVLFGSAPTDNLENTGSRIFQELALDVIIIHTPKQTLAWEAAGHYARDTFFVANPVISTGAGDNFNAGFCLGQLLSLDVDASILLANATSGAYVSSGKSPSVAALVHFMEKHIQDNALV